MFEEFNKKIVVNIIAIGKLKVKIKSEETLNKMYWITGNSFAPSKPNNSIKLVKNVEEYLPVQPFHQINWELKYPLLRNSTDEQKSSAQNLTKLLVVKT